jgi:hypothetical protein
MENNNGEGEKGAQEGNILRLEYPKPEEKSKQEENPNKPEETPKPVVEETNREIQNESQKEQKGQQTQKEKVDKCSTKVVGTITLKEATKVIKAVEINWSQVVASLELLESKQLYISATIIQTYGARLVVTR